jgi:uncharacterized repeat protein (TIGR01451 family)
MIPQVQRKSSLPNAVRLLLVFMLLAMALTALGGAKPVSAVGNPPAVQVYYVSLPESDAYTVFHTISSDTQAPIWTYVAIAIAADGTLVYYDQWENGYDANLANPADVYSNPGNLAGVQIWGNGDPTDGAPPGFASDVLNAGDVIVLDSNVDPTNPSAIDFDGRDKIGASGAIAVSRATWPDVPSALFAFAHELYPTDMWGTDYEAPVGTGTSSQNMFDYSALTIMATQDNTEVNLNGTLVATLNEGQTYLAEGIAQGDEVVATHPVQVQLLTGDIGSTYEARDMTLFPVGSWSNSYWSPVGVSTGGTGSNPTRLWLYNPGPGALYVQCDRRTSTVTVGPIAVNGTGTADVPNNEGAHCFAVDQAGAPTSQPFFGVGTVDTGGQNWDWSFTLVPDAFLTSQALVGLGLGYDPTSAATPDNGSPVWITPVCQTFVYVDWNNDGTPDLVDLNGDGDTSDTVNGIAESTSNGGMDVASLQSVRLFNPTRNTTPAAGRTQWDQTGAKVYSRATQGEPAPGCDLAAAWGEDPTAITAGEPGLDVGTTVPPLPLLTTGKSITLAQGGDKDEDGIISPGDEAIYTIQVQNIGAVPISNVWLYDEVPAHMTYVDGTTYKDMAGGGPVQIPDDLSDTTFPLDVLPDGVNLGALGPGEIGLVTFHVVLDETIGVDSIENCGVVRGGGLVLNSCVDIDLPADWGDLPDSYDTTRINGGPHHSFNQLILGKAWDKEADGQPSLGADGDDLNNLDDEDGVQAVGVWGTGTGELSVDVAGGPGCLNVWMDFTDNAGTAGTTDGDFVNAANADGYDASGGISEQVVVNQPVANGANSVTFSLPSGLFPAPNGYYVRVRLSPTDAVAPTCSAEIGHEGFVTGGEVEDYLFTFGPNAVTLTKMVARATTPIWVMALAGLLLLFAVLAVPLVRRVRS